MQVHYSRLDQLLIVSSFISEYIKKKDRHVVDKILRISFLVIGLLLSCNENKSIVGSMNLVGSVDKIYGIGLNRSITVGWDFTSTSISHFGVYRHRTAVFSYESALRIGTVLRESRPNLTDTGLVNGIQYSYTIVPEQQQRDGTFLKGFETKTISLIPVDLTIVPTDQLVFSLHIYPIFKKGCAIDGCHAGDDHDILKKSLHGGSKFLMSSWSSMMDGTDESAQIVPYRAVRSHLIQHINTDSLLSPLASPSMPPGFSFPIELRDVLIRWIDNGAKNDDGFVAYSTPPARGWAYVANQGEDVTAVIDLDKNKIARFITTGVENTNNAPPHAPHDIVLDWQNTFYYVNLIGSSTLLKFRVSDNVKVGELSTGFSSPAQVALSRNSDTAYVSNFENTKTNITIVNTLTMTKIGDISSPAMLKPHGVTITSDFKYVLTANSLSDNISVVQTSDNSIIKIIPLSGNVPALPIGYAFQYEPYQSVITPDNKYAYVTCRKSNEVRVIDLIQMKIIDSIKVGLFPLFPSMTPDGSHIFVANRNSNSVSAINTSARAVEFTIENVGVEPHGAAVSKDGKFIYVTCENLNVGEPPHHATIGSRIPSFLKIIDIETRKVVASLELGNFGSGIEVTN